MENKGTVKALLICPGIAEPSAVLKFFPEKRGPGSKRLAAHICGMSLSAGRKSFQIQLQVLQQRSRAIDVPFPDEAAGIQPG